jgi:hypothetical protein
MDNNVIFTDINTLHYKKLISFTKEYTKKNPENTNDFNYIVYDYEELNKYMLETCSLSVYKQLNEIFNKITTCLHIDNDLKETYKKYFRLNANETSKKIYKNKKEKNKETVLQYINKQECITTNKCLQTLVHTRLESQEDIQHTGLQIDSQVNLQTKHEKNNTKEIATQTREKNDDMYDIYKKLLRTYVKHVIYTLSHKDNTDTELSESTKYDYLINILRLIYIYKPTTINLDFLITEADDVIKCIYKTDTHPDIYKHYYAPIVKIIYMLDFTDHDKDNAYSKYNDVFINLPPSVYKERTINNYKGYTFLTLQTRINTIIETEETNETYKLILSLLINMYCRRTKDFTKCIIKTIIDTETDILKEIENNTTFNYLIFTDTDKYFLFNEWKGKLYKNTQKINITNTHLINDITSYLSQYKNSTFLFQTKENTSFTPTQMSLLVSKISKKYNIPFNYNNIRHLQLTMVGESSLSYEDKENICTYLGTSYKYMMIHYNDECTKNRLQGLDNINNVCTHIQQKNENKKEYIDNDYITCVVSNIIDNIN